MNDWIKRRDTKAVNVGDVIVGNNNPISVQSMTNTTTCDVLATVKQIKNRSIFRICGRVVKE